MKDWTLDSDAVDPNSHEAMTLSAMEETAEALDLDSELEEAERQDAQEAQANAHCGSLSPYAPAAGSLAAPSMSDFYGFSRFAFAQPELDAEEEAALGNIMRNGSGRAALQAAHALVLSQLRLVARISREHRGYGLPLEDLAQEGTIGLMKAVRRYDPERGSRLAPYAAFWIRSEVQKHILENWRVVKIGSSKALKKLFFGWRSTRARLEAENGAPLLGEDAKIRIAEELGVKPSQAQDAQAWFANAPVSLDAPRAGSAEEGPQEWNLPSAQATPEEALMEKEAQEATPVLVARALGTLNARERRVAQARFIEEPALTLSQLSQELEVSIERVRQIETAALKKMRAALLNQPETQAVSDTPGAWAPTAGPLKPGRRVKASKEKDKIGPVGAMALPA